MAGSFRGVVGALGGHSMVRFAVVGAIGFGTDIGLLYLLHGVLGMWLAPATGLAYLVAFALSFVLSREWVFSHAGDTRRQILRYCWLVAGVLLMTVLGVQALVWVTVPYLVAKVLVSAVVAVVNYVASRWWVFRAVPVVAQPRSAAERPVPAELVVDQR